MPSEPSGVGGAARAASDVRSSWSAITKLERHYDRKLHKRGVKLAKDG